MADFLERVVFITGVQCNVNMNTCLWNTMPLTQSQVDSGISKVQWRGGGAVNVKIEVYSYRTVPAAAME